ncbi:hypothetical protein CR159_08935 [Pollutimonas subterranea]|uniref:Uncharacterized protein n=1 Tax=Pollutimonas subterranea TaxID=2045210 RepID=A0A2N4U529_9BURK|nr:hypothetical protein CR159_08935 [Pollutimonas subterranea]
MRSSCASRQPGRSDIGAGINDDRSTLVKRPSTQLVPTTFQASMLQRGRSYGVVLQRLSGSSEPHAKGAPEGAYERGYAMFGAVGRRTGNEERNTTP